MLRTAEGQQRKSGRRWVWVALTLMLAAFGGSGAIIAIRRRTLIPLGRYYLLVEHVDDRKPFASRGGQGSSYIELTETRGISRIWVNHSGHTWRTVTFGPR